LFLDDLAVPQFQFGKNEDLILLVGGSNFRKDNFLYLFSTVQLTTKKVKVNKRITFRREISQCKYKNTTHKPK
jgi:hypothetical protein